MVCRSAASLARDLSLEKHEKTLLLEDVHDVHNVRPSDKVSSSLAWEPTSGQASFPTI
jgi:hypothetical protein